MELIAKPKSWFFSNEGQAKFSSLTSIAERAIFIFSYLRRFTINKMEVNNILFETSFLLANSVFNSQLPYHTYPALLDEKKNPFIAFLTKAKLSYSPKQLYCIYLSIIYDIANPFDENEWIYDAALFTDTSYMDKLCELGHPFLIPNELYLPNIKAYECDEMLKEIQLEIIWIFIKHLEENNE